MKNVGLKVKNIRQGLGLTIENLSQKLGVSHSYLTLIENGKRRLPKQFVKDLAKALHLPKDTVYDWFLEQELVEAGITDKKSHELIKSVLKMTLNEKESLLKIIRSLEKKDNLRS